MRINKTNIKDCFEFWKINVYICVGYGIDGGFPRGKIIAVTQVEWSHPLVETSSACEVVKRKINLSFDWMKGLGMVRYDGEGPNMVKRNLGCLR